MIPHDFPEPIKRAITGAALVAGFFILYFCMSTWAISSFLLFVMLIVLNFEWPSFKLYYLTPLYPVLPFILLMLLNRSDVRIMLPVLFVAVFGFDTGAYGVGKLIGRHKLWSQVSPSKTWEGVFGGLFASIFCTIIFFVCMRYPVHFYAVCAVCVLLSVAGTAGDLFESYLKRRVGLKDSGDMLPGHGGWLDRFDGILGAVIILYPLKHVLARFLGLC